MKVSVMFARFPYQAAEHPDSTDWLIRTAISAQKDPRIGEVLHTRLDDTPITMTRNLAVRRAQAARADYLVMLDSDMAPDIYTDHALPFWDSSLDFALQHRERPCIVGAPYVGPPPHCNVYVFQWANKMNDSSNPDFRLAQFGREEASQWRGVSEVGALPTGLILIDMRVFDLLKPPYFYYEWKDSTESEKASTEDVTFTRDAALAGAKIYCNWDAWAGHWKRFRGDKPQPLTVDSMRHRFVDAVRSNLRSDEIIVREDQAVPGTVLGPHATNFGAEPQRPTPQSNAQQTEPSGRRSRSRRKAS